MFEVHKLTGSVLVDANGRPQGMESAGVVATYRTLEMAEREACRLSRLGNGINRGRYQVRGSDGEVFEPHY
jgi:hypothetical protein